MQGAGEQNRDAGRPDDPQNVRNAGQSVGLRWLTAAIVIPIVLALVWFGGWVAFAGSLLVLAICTSELLYMLRNAGYHPPIIITTGLGILFLVAAMLPAQRLLILEIGLGAAILVPFPSLFFRQRLDGAVVDWSLTLAISIYLGWSVSCFLVLRGYEPVTLQFTPAFVVHFPHGVWWVLTVLLGVWGFDTAAFFSGRYLGRHRLAPLISPAKTWEGAIGGFALSMLATVLCTVVPLGVPWYLAVALGLLIGIAAILGDLAESLIKRQSKVKDSGQIMPGHGGLLDRIDSLLFAVIVVFLFAQFMGR